MAGVKYNGKVNVHIRIADIIEFVNSVSLTVFIRL